MVKIIDPKLGEKILDPFAGSAGFLVESFLYIENRIQKTTKNYSILQNETFYGYETKSLPFLLGIMNCILHRLQSPHIIKKNTFSDDLSLIPDAERFNVVLTNPPFGQGEGRGVTAGFPIRTQRTELMGLYYVMKMLRIGGRAGIVLPEGILFRTEGAYKQVKKELLENFNLHTVISLPPGVFANVSPKGGQGPKTNLLFFEKGQPTKEIWYYELTPPPGVKYTKKNPILDEHTKDAFEKWQKKAKSDASWTVSVEEIVAKNYDLSAKNPNGKGDIEHKLPKELLSRIEEKEGEINKLLREIKGLIT